jgi:Flp pilus assembly protein TadG
MSYRREHGSVTVFVTVITTALILVAGLVVDGGQILNTKREAANVAESAARAGAQEIDENAARRDGTVALDQPRAVDRATTFLAANGYEGTVSATTTTVTVTVNIRQPLLILGLGSMADVDVTGTGTATPIRAITASR